MNHIEPAQLMDFNFGLLKANARESAERHLATCSVCLSEYLSLKRDVELGATDDQVPSAKVRRSILQASMPQIILRRPGRVVAALLAAAAILAFATVRFRPLTPQNFPPHSTSSDVHSDAQTVDTARQVPENLNLL